MTLPFSRGLLQSHYDLAPVALVHLATEALLFKQHPLEESMGLLQGGGHQWASRNLPPEAEQRPHAPLVNGPIIHTSLQTSPQTEQLLRSRPGAPP